ETKSSLLIASPGPCALQRQGRTARDRERMEGIDAEGRGQQTKTIVPRAKACATCFPDYARQRAIQRTCQHFWLEHARSPESLQSGSKSCTCRAVSEFVTTLARLPANQAGVQHTFVLNRLAGPL